ncbi:DUF2063 domain-containing protein [Pseudomonas paraeruginosa]|uniref:DUF2063 domain-containing protein n=1 Tax=Pseudomonas aeruginosa TaxID=287 RepID=A0ABD7JUQ9_PSEAI|nr:MULTISPECIES: putative DNA-binding domain-containing protein [Pseudomonas aeruginosa group]KFF36201.1 hypothetical protein G039_0308035 [Pseudomonas aeruginosa VRFPA01]RTR90347.1 DUF2063 domain-containing protein [Pseudomonas paraeruginosa]RTS40436.1 DUF2063 domain-containing protein [Pseudomonas aeruginosa]
MSDVTLQRGFAARIRDPQASLPPGVAAERMALYEELFFNNLESFIRNGFPVLHSLFPAPRWERLVRAFLREHRCRTPYFGELGEEFLAWLQDGYRAEDGDPPFLLELAHYEWVELALLLAEAPAGRPTQAWSWSPLAWPLAYRWPVHRLGPEHRPAQPAAEPTCLLVWRDPAEQVRFLQLSPFAYCLALRLSEAGEAPGTLLPLLRELAENSGLEPDAQYFENAFALLEDWRALGILLGEGVLE